MEFLLQPLTLVTFFPLVGILVLLLLPGENKNLMRDLQFEKGRSEHLLENILPKSIIDALKGREETSSETLRSPVVAHAASRGPPL